MQETQEQIVTYELAEKHPATVKYQMPGNAGLRQYECFFCGVDCNPDISVKDVDVSYHSPDCIWRKARAALQMQILAEERRSQMGPLK